MFNENVLKESTGSPERVADVFPFTVPPPIISTTAEVMSGRPTSGVLADALGLMAGVRYAHALKDREKSQERPNAGVSREPFSFT